MEKLLSIRVPHGTLDFFFEKEMAPASASIDAYGRAVIGHGEAPKH
jgi:hypothetical protein